MKLYADGPTFDEIKIMDGEVDGYTFNPSLFRKLGANDYLEFSKKISQTIQSKPISIEVIGDTHEDCLRQAKVLNKISDNIWVKIPISFTDGSTTKNLVKNLIEEDIKLNITAIFTIDQLKEIIDIVKNSNCILSIFSGRIYDIGSDAKLKFTEMSYDYFTAKESTADIITMSPTLIKKMKLFNKDPVEYSKETVIGFYDDAKKAGYKI
jgi:transaldolase